MLTRMLFLVALLLPHTAAAPMPKPVEQIFRRACKDCHSNDTVWPWYAAIPPLSLAIASDVNRGKSIFNLSNWETYSTGRKRGFLTAIDVDISRGNMPPRAYRWMHSESNLSEPDRTMLRNWARQESARLRAAAAPKNPDATKPVINPNLAPNRAVAAK